MAEAPARSMLTRSLAGWRTYLRTHSRRAVIFGAVGFAVGWVFNVVGMARNYDGYQVPSRAAVTGQGNFFWGSLFSLAASLLVASVVSYRLEVGGPRFWAEVRAIPERVRTLLREDRDHATVHVLWGFAGAMVVVLFLAPAVSGVLAVGLLIALGGLLRPLVTSLLMLGWRAVSARLRPSHAVPPSPLGLSVAALGSSLALAVGYLASDPSTRLFLGLAAGAAAYGLGRRGRPTPATVFFLAAAAGVLAALADAAPALADDGGWRECGSSFSDWFGCPGSGKVIGRGTVGGLFTGLGSGLGSGLGGSTAEAPPVKPYEEMTEAERHRLRSEIIHQWRERNPNADWDQLRGILAQLEAQPPSMWDKITGFGKNFLDSIYQDFASGSAAERLWEMDKAFVEAFRQKGAEFVTGTIDMFRNSPEMLSTAANFWAGTSFEEVQRELGGVTRDEWNRFQGLMRDFEEASLRGDNQRTGQILGELAASAEFEVVMGWGAEKGLGMTGEALTKLRRSQLDEVVTGGRPRHLHGLEPGTKLSVEDLPGLAGIGESDAILLRKLAEDMGVEIQVRPANPHSVKLLEEGAHPKPEALKMKSINEYDVQLGAEGENLGKLGFFEPEMPAVSRSQNPELWRRYDERMAEYQKYGDTVDRLQQPGGASMYRYGEEVDLQIEVRDGVVYNKADGKPFVSDYDVHAVRNLDGSPLSEQQWLEVQRQIKEVANTQHGDTYSWRDAMGTRETVRDNLLGEYAPGSGKNVVKFSPTGIRAGAGPMLPAR